MSGTRTPAGGEPYEGEEITGVSAMGWSVSRHSEPGRKLDLFDRRIGRLQGVVKRRENANQVSSAAEKLRLAALAVIKAKRALISEYPQRDPNKFQSYKLHEEEQRWSTLSIQEIVAEYGGCVVQDKATVLDLNNDERPS